MGRLTGERLAELAEDGAAGMLIVPAALAEDARPDGWTHLLERLQTLPDGTREALLRSRRTGELYIVARGYCTCPHAIYRVQSAGPDARCKHSEALAALLDEGDGSDDDGKG